MQTSQIKRQIFGWLMYDWANSAYVTTVAVAVLPAYFAAAIVPESGYTIGSTTLSATSLWGYAVSLAALFVFLLAPFLGAIADYSSIKKNILTCCCLMGSLAATLLAFAKPGMIMYTLAFFTIAQIGFVGGNVFYDAFLPHLGPKKQQDSISGKGFAFGYVGGGLQFALSLLLLATHDLVGLDKGQAARVAIGTAGLWWAGFGLFAISRFKETPTNNALPNNYTHLPRVLGYAIFGWKRVLVGLRTLMRDKQLLIFLIAFLCYNDGIQTVINMATIYGKQELKLSTTLLMATLLLIQFVAIFGALLFSRLAEKFSAKKALMPALTLWCGVAVYAYFLQTATEYVIMGGVVGLILGGSQALSRSLYSSMIPKESSAEYFAYFSVVNKFSSIIGPLVFAVVTQYTGSSRGAILSLVLFFIVGMVLLARVRAPNSRNSTHAEHA